MKYMQNIVYPMKLMSSNLCCPPPMDWLKINVDGGLNVQSEDGGAGVAIRHDNESFFASKCSRLAELLAAREGVKLLDHLGIQKVILKMDNFGCGRKKLKSAEVDRSYGSLI